MNQEKTGKFIAQCRKEQGLTQALLAERLGISDRAVSKWETGRNMPDASIMLELCEVLNININELFSGERLNMDQYKNKAEEHLLQLRTQEETANRKLLAMENVIGYTSSVAFILLVFAASFAVTDTLWRISLLAAGLVFFAVGVAYCLKIEHDAGYYECPECGETYIPSMKAVVFALHIGRNRKMTCPHCAKERITKKCLRKNENMQRDTAAWLCPEFYVCYLRYGVCSSGRLWRNWPS